MQSVFFFSHGSLIKHPCILVTHILKVYFKSHFPPLISVKKTFTLFVNHSGQEEPNDFAMYRLEYNLYTELLSELDLASWGASCVSQTKCLHPYFKEIKASSMMDLSSKSFT